MLPTVQLPILLQNVGSSLLQLPFFSPSYPPVFRSSSPLVFSRLHLLIPLPIFHLLTSLPLHISSLMADMDHSSSDDVSDDSRVSVQTSQDSKLEFSEDEETLIERMFNLIGERWTLIAGRIPGRTAEEIEKYWTTRYSTSD